MAVRNPLAIALAILFLAEAVGAAEPRIQTLKASPNPVAAGQPVEVTLTKKGPKCAVLVDYGAGTHHVGIQDGSHQVKLPAIYTNAGTHTITAAGKKKGNAPACKGSVPPVTVVVKASEAVPPPEEPPNPKGPKLGTGPGRSESAVHPRKASPPHRKKPTVPSATPREAKPPPVPIETNPTPECPGCLL